MQTDAKASGWFSRRQMTHPGTKMLEIKEFDPITNHNITQWLNGPYDEQTKQTIKNLLRDNPQELIDSFHTNLSFGTGGLRAIMNVGTNRINLYTIRTATQGLANYINKQAKTSREHAIFIGYDTRHHSRQFAEECAKVLAGNGIRAYICEDVRPTPLVSFGCRYKKCSAAIILTASHNPPQYNGYKVYWSDGSQIIFPHDQGIVEEINKISDIRLIKNVANLKHPLIEWIGKEVDEAYIDTTRSMQLYPEDNKKYGKSLHIVYTSLHGTGITLVPPILHSWGFSNIELVKDQVIQNGDFPNCSSPNPEEPESLKLGINTLLEVHGDILIATDPDADRIGVVVNHEGELHRIDGNQMACLLLNYILKALSSQKRLPKKGALVKTIVTSELFAKIGSDYKKPCFNVLPGFKYVAKIIREWENSSVGYQYIFGAEESYGYLYGTWVRDKDAVLSSALICEMALHAKLKGKTLIDMLHTIWKKHGVYVEKLISVDFKPTRNGKDQMTKIMLSLKNNPLQNLAGVDVIAVEDYSISRKLHLKTGKIETITLPKTEGLSFHLTNGSKLFVRPSGTEPKIKIYCSIVKSSKNIPQALAESERLALKLLEALKNELILEPANKHSATL